MAFFAVMVDPGRGCIGAYRVGPVCIVYGTAKGPSLGALPATSLTVGGPSVPLTLARPAMTSGGNVPVIPVRLKREE